MPELMLDRQQHRLYPLRRQPLQETYPNKLMKLWQQRLPEGSLTEADRPKEVDPLERVEDVAVQNQDHGQDQDPVKDPEHHVDTGSLEEDMADQLP